MDNINKLQKLCNKASKGVWKYDSRTGEIVAENNDAYTISTVYSRKNGNHLSTKDIEFIIAAHNMFPEILQEIEQLRNNNIVLRLQLLKEQQEFGEFIKTERSLYHYDSYGRRYLSF